MPSVLQLASVNASVNLLCRVVGHVDASIRSAECREGHRSLGANSGSTRPSVPSHLPPL